MGWEGKKKVAEEMENGWRRKVVNRQGKRKDTFKVQCAKITQAKLCFQAAIKLQATLQRWLSAICTCPIRDGKVAGMENNYT